MEISQEQPKMLFEVWSTVASEIGGDVATTAVNAVEGAIKAATEVGSDVGHAAESAVLGAIHAADEIGDETGKAVRDALLASAALPKEIVKSAIGKK